MLPVAAPYLVAIFAMLFAASSGLTWIHAVRHFDPPEDAAPPAASPVGRAA